MSAYMVKNHVVAYIIKYAEATKMMPYLRGANGVAYTPVEACNMLLAENMRSVNYRYRENDRAPFISQAEYDNMMWPTFDPLRVLKTIRCIEYQSCETEDYRTTAAYRLLIQIQCAAVGDVLDRQNVEYGTPEPMRRNARGYYVIGA